MGISKQQTNIDNLTNRGYKIDELDEKIKFIEGKYVFVEKLFNNYLDSKKMYASEETRLQLKNFIEVFEDFLKNFILEKNIKNHELEHEIIRNTSENQADYFFKELINFINNEIKKDSVLEKFSGINPNILNFILKETSEHRGFLKDFSKYFLNKNQNKKEKKQNRSKKRFALIKNKDKKKSENKTDKNNKVEKSSKSYKTLPFKFVPSIIKNKKSTIKTKTIFRIPKAPSPSFVALYLKFQQKKKERRRQRFEKFCKFAWIPFKAIFGVGKFLLNTTKLITGIVFFIQKSIFALGKFVTNAVKRLFSKEFWEKGFGRFVLTTILSNRSLLFWTTVFFVKIFKTVFTCIFEIEKFIFKIIKFTGNIVLKITKFLGNISLEGFKTFLNATINVIKVTYAKARSDITGIIIGIMAAFISGRILKQLNIPLSSVSAFFIGKLSLEAYDKLYGDKIDKNFESVIDKYSKKYLLGEQYIKDQFEDNYDAYKNFNKYVDDFLNNKKSTKEQERENELHDNPEFMKKYNKHLSESGPIHSLDINDYDEMLKLKNSNPKAINNFNKLRKTVADSANYYTDIAHNSSSAHEKYKIVTEQLKMLDDILYKPDELLKFEEDDYIPEKILEANEKDKLKIPLTTKSENSQEDFNDLSEDEKIIARAYHKNKEKEKQEEYLSKRTFDEKAEDDYIFETHSLDKKSDEFKKRLFDINYKEIENGIKFDIFDKMNPSSEKKYFLKITDSNLIKQIMDEIGLENSLELDDNNRKFYSYITENKKMFVLFNERMEEILKFPIDPFFIEHKAIETNINDLKITNITPNPESTVQELELPDTDTETNNTNNSLEKQTNIPQPDLPEVNLTRSFGLNNFTDDYIKTFLSEYFSKETDYDIQKIKENLTVQKLLDFLNGLRENKNLQINPSESQVIAENKFINENNILLVGFTQKKFKLPTYDMDIFRLEEKRVNGV